MKAIRQVPPPASTPFRSLEDPVLRRRGFLGRSLAGAGGLLLSLPARPFAANQPTPKPLGLAKGIHPGRVVWSHDPDVLDWKGPEDGHWWEGKRLKQDRVDTMLTRTVCELTGQRTSANAWPALFRHLNQARGKGDLGYRPGQKIAIKPNWVGLIYHEGHVDLEKYVFIRRHDYMNTAPQLILTLINQLTSVGVAQRDITVCDTLACLVHEFYDILHGTFPDVQYADHEGKFDRVKVSPSTRPLYWSSRPEGKAQDYVPACFAEADYVINVANLKAHTGGGVTLCAKNHYGSLVRWPVQKDYYDLHPNCFSKSTEIYRPLVDLIGHADLGGKTMLYLVDGLFAGVHPRDPLPQRMEIAPFNGNWPRSLLASQDPVAIDSVAFDFLSTQWPDFARQGGAEDYLHEAALAAAPPSGTSYDPNHATPTQRLPSLGAHEHWNNPEEKKYSRNLETGEGIELMKV